jgi:thiol:disulfide interchange protein DsbD
MNLKCMKPNHRLTSLLVSFLVAFTTNLAFAGVGSVGGFDDEEPLMPDQAFALSTKVIDANTVRAEWIIADKYYLYRNKFKFISKTEGIAVKPGSYPKGEIHEDEFFGKVETYRGKVAIDIPLNRTGSAKTLVLDITSQGCADMGICYPPQKQTVSFKLPAIAAASATPSTPSATSSAESKSSFNPLQTLKSFGNSLGLLDSNEGFLPPEQAFTFSAEALDGNTIRAHWDVVDDVYLYRDKFKFKLKDITTKSLSTFL